MADGIDTAVPRMQPAGLNAPSDPSACEADGEQLRGRRDRVLSCRELGEPNIGRWAAFVPHTGTKGAQRPDFAPRAELPPLRPAIPRPVEWLWPGVPTGAS